MHTVDEITARVQPRRRVEGVSAVLMSFSYDQDRPDIYAIFPDIHNIERREGIYAAAFTFMRKLSSAVALFVVSTGLSLAGYLPPVEEVVDGATRLVEQPQTETFLLTLRLIFALVPIVLLALALVFAVRFPLTAAVHRRLRAVLDVVRHGGTLTAAEAAEARALHRLLLGREEG